MHHIYSHSRLGVDRGEASGQQCAAFSLAPASHFNTPHHTSHLGIMFLLSPFGIGEPYYRDAGWFYTYIQWSHSVTGVGAPSSWVGSLDNTLVATVGSLLGFRLLAVVFMGGWPLSVGRGLSHPSILDLGGLGAHALHCPPACLIHTVGLTRLTGPTCAID